MNDKVFLIDKPVKKVIPSYFAWDIVDEIIFILCLQFGAILLPNR